jgi:hypothetical protein
MRRFTVILMLMLFSITMAFADTIFTEDFEGSVTDWKFGDAGQTNKWEHGTATANGGTYSAYISDDGGTTAGYDQSYTQASWLEIKIDLAGFDDASLAFYWRCVGEKTSYNVYDYGEVYINDGVDHLVSDIQEYVDNDSWTQETGLDISAYVGDSVTLKFKWYNDASSGTDPGFCVDDILLTGAPSADHNFATLNNAADSRSLPDTTVIGGSSVTFHIVAQNQGLTTEASPIKWTCTGGSPVSDTDENTASLALNDKEDHMFSPTWTAPSTVGIYTLKFYTDLAGDEDRSNDTTEVIISVSVPQTPPVTENFDGVTAPAIPDFWSVENTNDDSYTWETSTSNPLSEPNCMRIRYNTSIQMNDWFFSCPLDLTGGKDYWVSFWYRGHNESNQEKLELYACTGAASADTISGGQIFNNDDISSDTYAKGKGSFTPASDGAYYIGWHGYSYANKWYIYIDDIKIEEAPTTPICSVNPNSAGFGLLNLKDTSEVQVLTVTNSGIGTLTISSVSVTGTDADQFVLADANSYPIDLGEDESIAFNVSFAPTSEGDKSAQITIVDNVTTTTNIPLTGEGVILFEDFEEYSSEPSGIGWYGANDTEIFNPGGVALSHDYDGEWRSDDFGNEPDLTNSARFNYYSTTNNDSDLLVTPVIDLTENSGENILEFDIALTLYTGTTSTTMDDNDTLYVVVSENGATGTLAEFTTGGIVATFTNSTPISNTGDHIVIDLVSFGSRGSVQIAFYGKDPSRDEATDYNLYIDNVKVTKNPASAIDDNYLNEIPETFSLHQNYPNPFNPVTTISYALPKASDITIEVFNLLGQKVKTLINAANQKAGAYNVVWNGKDQFGNQVSSGIYFYRIQAGDFIQAKKMVLMK